MIAVVILVAAVISRANAGCTLPQGTNGSHDVLIPGHQGTNGSQEVLIPGHQSSIPSVALTTPPSETADRAPLEVVDSGRQNDDSCGGGDYQAMAAGIHRNDCVAEFPPHHVDVAALTGEISTGTSTDQIRTEERVEDDDEKDSLKFGNTLVGLTFEAAVALMVSSFQPRRNLSLLATWSPSRSTSSPPPPPTPSLLTSSASFPIIMVQLAIVFGFTVNLIGWLMFRRGRVAIAFGFTVSLIGWMMLRRGRVTEANFCRCAGFFSVAVAFFSMTYRFVPDHLAWAVWAAAGVPALVFAYSLGERLRSGLILGMSLHWRRGGGGGPRNLS